MHCDQGGPAGWIAHILGWVPFALGTGANAGASNAVETAGAGTLFHFGHWCWDGRGHYGAIGEAVFEKW